MSGTATRRVRVTIEGPAHQVTGKSELLRLDMPKDETGLSPVLMVNPAWPGVTVEDLAPSYNWQDGDVVLDPSDGEVVWRDGGRWSGSRRGGAVATWTDGEISRWVGKGWSVLRYQAGDQ